MEMEMGMVCSCMLFDLYEAEMVVERRKSRRNAWADMNLVEKYVVFEFSELLQVLKSAEAGLRLDSACA
jgi:hypothetical protein